HQPMVLGLERRAREPPRARRLVGVVGVVLVGAVVGRVHGPKRARSRDLLAARCPRVGASSPPRRRPSLWPLPLPSPLPPPLPALSERPGSFTPPPPRPLARLPPCPLPLCPLPLGRPLLYPSRPDRR